MADLPGRVHPPELRASDADRERVATVLRQATAEGRLDLAELDERLAVVYAGSSSTSSARDRPTTNSSPARRAGAAPLTLLLIDGPVAGWAVLGGVFVATGLAVPALTRRALHRPGTRKSHKGRKPPTLPSTRR